MNQPQKEWNPKIKLPGEHRGQLKLLIGCMTLFTLLLKGELAGKIVVYAGAASGQNIAILSKMYEDLEFHLYDPAPFAIKESEKLHIYQELFTDEIAKYWSRVDGVIFISDIRSSSGRSKKDFEEDVHNNMIMQKRWVEIVRPFAYFLKFRIPYTVIESGRKYPYLGGKLLYQSYPKPDSMEMRLFGTMNDNDVEYDSPILERILFYHNSMVRPHRNRYLNVFTDSGSPYVGETALFYRDYDSTYFLYVLSHFFGDTANSTKVLATAQLLVEQLMSRKNRV